MKIQCNAHLRDLSLAREHDNYKLMQGCVCNLAQIIDYGEEGPWTFLVVTDLEVDSTEHRGPLSSTWWDKLY